MKSVSDDKPNVFQNLGNGSWFYNYDFKEVDQPQEVDQENVPVKKSWECESVKVWGIPTSKTVKKAVISNTWDVTQEIDLAMTTSVLNLGFQRIKLCKTSILLI